MRIHQHAVGDSKNLASTRREHSQTAIRKARGGGIGTRFPVVNGSGLSPEKSSLAAARIADTL